MHYEEIYDVIKTNGFWNGFMSTRITKKDAVITDKVIRTDTDVIQNRTYKDTLYTLFLTNYNQDSYHATCDGEKMTTRYKMSVENYIRADYAYKTSSGFKTYSRPYLDNTVYGSHPEGVFFGEIYKTNYTRHTNDNGAEISLKNYDMTYNKSGCQKHCYSPDGDYMGYYHGEYSETFPHYKEDGIWKLNPPDKLCDHTVFALHCYTDPQ